MRFVQMVDSIPVAARDEMSVDADSHLNAGVSQLFFQVDGALAILLTPSNPLPLLGAIVTGIGFLGAGALTRTDQSLWIHLGFAHLDVCHFWHDHRRRAIWDRHGHLPVRLACHLS